MGTAQNKGFWQLGPDGTVNASGGGGGSGGITTPKPLTIDYAQMDILDGYVTGVTEHAPGDYSFSLDYTQNRTFPSNADLAFCDVLTDWAALGATDYRLVVEIEVVSEPDDLSGTPYVAAYLKSNAAQRSTGVGAVLALMFHDTGDRSVRQNSSISTDVSADSSMGTPANVRLIFQPQTGTGGNMRFGMGVEAETSNGPGGLSMWSRSAIISSFTTANVSTGYDVAGGGYLALAFQQRVAGSGTGSMRLRFSYWFTQVR